MLHCLQCVPKCIACSCCSPSSGTSSAFAILSALSSASSSSASMPASSAAAAGDLGGGSEGSRYRLLTAAAGVVQQQRRRAQAEQHACHPKYPSLHTCLRGCKANRVGGFKQQVCCRCVAHAIIHAQDSFPGSRETCNLCASFSWCATIAAGTGQCLLGLYPQLLCCLPQCGHSLSKHVEVYAVPHLMHQHALPGGRGSQGQPR